MAKRRPNEAPKPVPACYAHVLPGLESVAADEITRDLGGEVKKTARGLVVFRVPEITPDLLKLRTTEDVYLLAWGSDSLTYKADDLRTIRNWTNRKPDWPHLFRTHHSVRPLRKGKPTFHLVCQMQGEHGYRRVDALDAMADGLTGHVPAGWLPADENAWLEVWLNVHGKAGVCGVRLSDRTMRHRTYKEDHVLASLRPTVAASMVRLAGAGPGMTVLDPMCGAGTIAAEQIELAKRRKAGMIRVLAGDIDPNALFVTRENLVKVGPADLVRWDATRLPLAAASVDRIVCNPPFGKQLSSLDKVPGLYAAFAAECDRVLRPGGRAVFLVAEREALRQPLFLYGWAAQRQFRVQVLGQLATMSVWQKPS